MSHKIGFVDNSDGVLAHYKMLEEIKTLAEANGWVTLRYRTDVENRELILKGKGYTGAEEIFVGVRTYQNADADYYNLCAAGFTGYVEGNTFDSQPGAVLSGVPSHNQHIDYWLTATPQKISLTQKIGNPVYMAMYLGKMLPYARPSQYPYPLICAGMLKGPAPVRFSNTSISIPYKGHCDNLQLRTNAGWMTPYAWPYYTKGSFVTKVRDTGGHYHIYPIELIDNDPNYPHKGEYGCLDGIGWITGFNNVVEDTLVIDGKTWVIFEDVNRHGFGDMYAMRMD